MPVFFTGNIGPEIITTNYSVYWLMIYVPRPPEPEYFRSPRVMQAKEELRAQFNDPDRQKRLEFRHEIYAHPDVRNALDELFKGKCAYCESDSSAGSRLQIEHYRPKMGARGLNGPSYDKHYWWLAYEWENLLPACSTCNNAKRTYFPIEGERATFGVMGDELAQEKPLLLNPCIDRPGEHLLFEYDGTVSGLTKRGAATIELVNLNRAELVVRRKKPFDEILLRLTKILISDLHSGAMLNSILSLVNGIQTDSVSSNSTIRLTYAQSLLSLNRDKIEAQLNDVDKYSFSTFLNSVNKEIQPAPSVAQDVQQDKAQMASLRRFSIKRIEIRNFKSITHLNLTIPPRSAKEERESWLLLLGDNGVGKSSILQAITLALSSKKHWKKLAIKPSNILRRKARSGYVKIHSYEQDDPIELYFDRKGIRGGASEPPSFIIAYGATRLLPQGTLKPESVSNRYIKIGNLFDYSIALNPVDKWLKQLSQQVPEQLEQNVRPTLFDLLMLSDKLDRIAIENGHLRVNGYALDEISDGYRSIVALACDIMQTLSADQSSYHLTQGIVLIDELGSHLHPRWRMQIVASLRKAFPNLQFIVTTHEPLCLRGVAQNEITVLIRNEENQVESLAGIQVPDPSYLRVDQLLTSPLFGLHTIMDPSVELAFNEYYGLLARRSFLSVKEQTRLQQLQDELQNKGQMGHTTRQELLYQAIDKVVADYRTESPIRVDSIDKETVNRLAELWKQADSTNTTP